VGSSATAAVIATFHSISIFFQQTPDTCLLKEISYNRLTYLCWYTSVSAQALRYMADPPASLVIHGRPTSVGTYRSPLEPRDISSADLQCVAGVPSLCSLSYSTATTIKQPLHINNLWSNHNSMIQHERPFPTNCAACSHFYAYPVFALRTVTIFLYFSSKHNENKVKGKKQTVI